MEDFLDSLRMSAASTDVFLISTAPTLFLGSTVLVLFLLSAVPVLFLYSTAPLGAPCLKPSGPNMVW